MPEVIEQILANRRLEPSDTNLEHALAVVQTTERHISTAKTLTEMDDEGVAFTAFWNRTRSSNH